MFRRLLPLLTVPVGLVGLLGCQPVETPLPAEAPAEMERQGDQVDFADGPQQLRVEVEFEEGEAGCADATVDLRWYGTDGVSAEVRVADAGVYDVVLEDGEVVPIASLELAVESIGDGLCLATHALEARADEGVGFFAVAPHADHRGVDAWVYVESLD